MNKIRIPSGPTLFGDVWVSIKNRPTPDNVDRLKIIFEIIIIKYHFVRFSPKSKQVECHHNKILY